MKKYPQITNALLGAIKRAGYTGMSITKKTGIPYPTFNRRLRDPGSWRICELKALFKWVELNESERKEVMKCLEDF